ncbi:CU044_2847 family protein [Catenuloplanes indicus]|uniref:Trypsin-co-occurring domain-containing protein n=1 Tax=Catenuloplanes indicus TaxID=137267 RepID=A0AAE3W794_9ACTN|nr:CU044_2847 family protein [Catenuloplanes indicus]MDQ0371153.1 hypothetical protein [Catenuloplanes indicus]
MPDLMRITLDDGSDLYVQEAGPPAEGPVKAGRIGDTIEQFTGTLRSALDPVVQACRDISDRMRPAGADECTVEFGVTLSAVAGAVVAKAGTGCHLKVRLTWSKQAS